MYDWRKFSGPERRKLLAHRKRERLPWHRPVHMDAGDHCYHLSAACYGHMPVIGKTVDRMIEFETFLLESVGAVANRIHAWCVLPNHDHLLAHVSSLERLAQKLGRIHGRKSHQWNTEDDS